MPVIRDIFEFKLKGAAKIFWPVVLALLLLAASVTGAILLISELISEGTVSLKYFGVTVVPFIVLFILGQFVWK